MTATKEQAKIRYEWLTKMLSELIATSGENWTKGQWEAFNSIRSQQKWLEKILA